MDCWQTCRAEIWGWQCLCKWSILKCLLGFTLIFEDAEWCQKVAWKALPPHYGCFNLNKINPRGFIFSPSSLRLEELFGIPGLGFLGLLKVGTSKAAAPSKIRRFTLNPRSCREIQFQIQIPNSIFHFQLSLKASRLGQPGGGSAAFPRHKKQQELLRSIWGCWDEDAGAAPPKLSSAKQHQEFSSLGWSVGSHLAQD